MTLRKPTRVDFFAKCRHVILLHMSLLISILVPAQTNISGIVNSYYSVVEVIPAKACVRLNSVAGLARLQKTLLIQMKGASVITTNNSSFGDTTALNDAGNYEIAIICAIRGDSVFMFHNFLNSYTVADKVQLVKFAEYYAANVTDTIKAASWNNTAATGGVVALSVSTSLVLNAPVFADSAGFRGGGYVLSNGTCSNFAAATGYFYNGSQNAPQNGAYKGESVYDFPVAQSGGRGAPANGGGGGNNHNNGGAGGANLNGGGKGGGNSSSAGCTTELHGLAGKPLSSWNGKKIFLGGGGGAGHSNGTLTVSNGGGHGGGIIFIIADTLVGNGNKISANGSTGGGAVSDGASGGGGAGTIVMNVTTYSGSVTIQANGGKGGDEDDAGTVQRCYGAGGGGSGGTIYFTGAVPGITINSAGGNAGLEFGGDPGCNAQVPAAAGLSGSTISSYAIRQSTDSSSYCLSISALPVRLIYFTATAQQKKVQLNWRVGDPEMIQDFIVESLVDGNWRTISKTAADEVQDIYSFDDNHPQDGINLYRVKIVEKTGTFFYSPIRQVNLGGVLNSFAIYPNPASNQLIISGKFSSIVNIRLFDISGKLQLHKQLLTNAESVALDVSPFQAGVYLVQINNEVKKLVISR